MNQSDTSDARAPRDQPEPPDTFLSIDEACRLFGVSRRTFYRMLADRRAGLGKVVLRIPPRTGHIRVPVRRFEEWLRARQEG